MLFEILLFLNMTTENKNDLIKKIFSLVGNETLTADEALYLLMLIYKDKTDDPSGDSTSPISPGTIPYTPPALDSIKPNSPYTDPYTCPYGWPHIWYTTAPGWEVNKIYCNTNSIDGTHSDTKAYNDTRSI